MVTAIVAAIALRRVPARSEAPTAESAGEPVAAID
jgi:hypothetical protein